MSVFEGLLKGQREAEEKVEVSGRLLSSPSRVSPEGPCSLELFLVGLPYSMTYRLTILLSLLQILL